MRDEIFRKKIKNGLDSPLDCHDILCMQGRKRRPSGFANNDEKEQVCMYKIGELSRLCQLPVKTLRYYDSIGLLVPDEIDRFTGYRYYSAAKIADCNRIVALKELGFSLDEVRAYLHSESAEHLALLLDVKLAELRTSLAKTTLQLKQLTAIRERLDEEHMKQFDLVFRKADEISVAFTREVFPRKENVYDAIESMKQALPAKIVGRRTVVVNYECEYRESEFDLAACVEITGKLPGDSVFAQKTLTFSGEIASIVCQKEELDAAYRSMATQLDEASAQVVGAYYEICYDDGTVELRVPVWRASAADGLQDEKRELPFVNDEEVLGKWKLLDIVPSEEQFLYGRRKHSGRNPFEELYFLEGGEPYWVFGGWTKGILFTGEEKCEHLYTIRQMDGHKLLFLQLKKFHIGGDVPMGAPQVYVYEKVSDAILHADDIRRRDRVDHPFVADESVLGEWQVKDFYCDSLERFDPKLQNWEEEDLFFRKVSFLPGGDCLHVTQKGESRLKWTKGYILNPRWEIASAYRIRVIDGKEYLIVEWKTGDYAFGPADGHFWYIFTRA